MKKINNRWTVSTLVLLIGLLISSSPAMAVSLQLDILNGTYDNGTTYSQGNVFTLYALLVPNSINLKKHDYIISAAITPKQAEVVDANFGSIKFGSETLNADTMSWGTPPYSADKELIEPSHGIFPTYYWEQTFNFIDTSYGQYVNVAKPTWTHTGPIDYVSGAKMWYQAFDIDASGLEVGYEVHFDLYHVDSNGAWVANAPYTADAQDPAKVPEPSTLVLLGFGLMGVSLFGRKKQ